MTDVTPNELQEKLHVKLETPTLGMLDDAVSSGDTETKAGFFANAAQFFKERKEQEALREKVAGEKSTGWWDKISGLQRASIFFVVGDLLVTLSGFFDHKGGNKDAKGEQKEEKKGLFNFDIFKTFAGIMGIVNSAIWLAESASLKNYEFYDNLSDLLGKATVQDGKVDLSALDAAIGEIEGKQANRNFFDNIRDNAESYGSLAMAAGSASMLASGIGNGNPMAVMHGGANVFAYGLMGVH